MKSRSWVRLLVGILMTLIICIAGCWQGSAEAANTSNATSSATSNVTSSTKTVKVGYYEDNNGFQMGSKPGDRMYGYAYEYYQELAKKAGWTYEYVYGSWSDLYEKLETGEIDIMAGVSKTAPREKLFLYPDIPMGNESYYLFIPSSSEAIHVNDPESLQNKRIGVNAHSLMQTYFEQYVKQHSINCTIKTYPGHFETAKALGAGEIDGFVITDNYVVEGVKPVLKVGFSDIFFALAKGRTDLLEDINEAQREIVSVAPYYAQNLSKKYFDKSIVRVGLNQKELEWLKQRNTISIGYLTNLLPYTDIEGEEEATDSLLDKLAHEIALYTGKYVTQKGYNTKEEMLAALHSGEIDAAFPIYNDLWLAEQQKITITDSVFTDRAIAVYKGPYSKDIFKKIGIPRKIVIHESVLKQTFPNTELHIYDDIDACLKALSSGEITCMRDASNLWVRYKSKHKVDSSLRYSELNEEMSFCMAVAQDNSILCSILNRALLQLKPNVVSDAINKNLYAEPKYTLREFLEHNILLAHLILLGIIALLAGWIIYYNVQKRENMENLQQKEQAEYSARHDNLTGALNRNGMDYVLNLPEVAGKPLAMLFVDMDYFKTINDTYGHNEGDNVLVKLNEALERNFRTTDYVIRLGGDEFIVLMANCKRFSWKQVTQTIANIHRELAEEIKLDIPVSISVGICVSQTGYYDGMKELADEALYRTKEKGRAGCVLIDSQHHFVSEWHDSNIKH